MKPPTTPVKPRARAKEMRGGLPLQIVQRMKFGWFWMRSDASTAWKAMRSALGCVV